MGLVLGPTDQEHTDVGQPKNEQKHHAWINLRMTFLHGKIDFIDVLTLVTVPM